MLIRLAALDGILNQQQSLELTIADLFELMESMPEGKLYNRLLNQIGWLNSIANVMQPALDSALGMQRLSRVEAGVD